jgi:hypothetical protein
MSTALLWTIVFVAVCTVTSLVLGNRPSSCLPTWLEDSYIQTAPLNRDLSMDEEVVV